MLESPDHYNAVLPVLNTVVYVWPVVPAVIKQLKNMFWLSVTNAVPLEVVDCWCTVADKWQLSRFCSSFCLLFVVVRPMWIVVSRFAGNIVSEITYSVLSEQDIRLNNTRVSLLILYMLFILFTVKRTDLERLSLTKAR